MKIPRMDDVALQLGENISTWFSQEEVGGSEVEAYLKIVVQKLANLPSYAPTDSRDDVNRVAGWTDGNNIAKERDKVGTGVLAARLADDIAGFVLRPTCRLRASLSG